MNGRGSILTASVFLAIAGWSGCRSGPPPDTLFREGEALRLAYENAASAQAIAKYEAAAAAWAAGKDVRRAARAGQRAGATYAQLGRLHQSLAAYRVAAAAAKASGDLALESELMSAVGTARSLVAAKEADFNGAQKDCEAALELSRRAGGGLTEARAFICLGEAAYNRGERERALDLYGQAAVISTRLGDRPGRAEALLDQGTVFSDRNEFERAAECLRLSTEAFADLGDARGTAIALVAVSKLQERRGAYQDALNGLHAALERLQRIGDLVWEGACLSAIGSVYMRTGEAVTALDYWERAQHRFNTAGLATFSVDLLRTLGEAYLASGNDTQALDCFERALALGVGLGDDHWQAYALQNMGAVYLSRGDAAPAITFFLRSLAVQARIRDPRTEAETRVSLGEAWRLAGAYGRARPEFDTAVALSQAAEDRAWEARALDGLARLAMAQGDLEHARSQSERSLELAESLRANVGGRDLRASYLASVHRYHETHMDVLMRLHKARPERGLAAAAFEASERARARSLLDGLAEAGVDLRTDVDPALLQRERALTEAFGEWAARQRQAFDDHASADLTRRLADDYRDLETRNSALEAEIRSRSPHYAALAKPQPLTLRQVQQQVLDRDTLLLEYALGEDRSYLWAVSASGYSVHELPARAEVERIAQQLYARLTARLTVAGTLQERRRQAEESDRVYWETATRLSEMLLGPVGKVMAGKRILVVADGALQYVPFGALPSPGGSVERVPLIADHEVVSLPSASALAVLRRETAGRLPQAGAVAVLADPVFERDDPRLRAAVRASGAQAGRPAGPPPGVPASGGQRGFPRLAATRLEADAIVRAGGGSASLKRLDFDASRAAAMSPELGRYRVVHFATHGVFDNDNPGMSGIMLSLFDSRGRPQDGFLRVHDIYRLHLPADLVVLSACNTALGRHVTGEGLVGVVRGFMYAGAKRVVASLWKVDDEATGELMRRFYEGMLVNRLSAAAALREAQVGVWSQARWKSPYYWAAFSLQGEWRP
ncbi:MAG: CHAT domain-containing tetratricopeptide repeat protein [Vicinamibacterales bacterium]|nr:CHAT domain-containing tetratricopeptide repeat protein [Vicinamibacterales bacterium]